MSNRYQTIVLQKGLSVALVAINFLGLFPFRYDRSIRQLKYSSVKGIYSIFVLCSGLCAYVIIGQMSYVQDNTLFSFTLRLVLFMYAYSILVSFAIAYLNQHWFATEVEFSYNKWMDVVEAIGNSFRDVDYFVYFFEIILKTIVFDILHCYCLYNNMKSSSPVITAKPYFGFILMMPQIVTRLHINIFYGGILAISVYIKKLNVNLSDIVTRAASITGRNGAKHKWLRMDNYCYFSDEIDKLSVLYYKLVEATKSINSIFSVPLTVWNGTIFVIITLEFLYQFVAIIELAQGRKKDSTTVLHAIEYLSILLSIFDLLSTSNACQRLVDFVSRLTRH